MIKITDLKKKYKNEDLISYSNYEFKDGKSYIILGPSGCGKSTLLNLIGLILSPDDGCINIDGVDMTSLSLKEKDQYRINNIGYIFQDFKLINKMTVMDNLNILNIENINTSKSLEILDKLGIKDKKNKKIIELSSGEKQRVAIARALIKNPKIILADEPTGNLNSEIGKNVIEELTKLSQDKCLIVVSHDESLTKYFDYVIRMDSLLRKEDLTNA